MIFFANCVSFLKMRCFFMSNQKEKCIIAQVDLRRYSDIHRGSIFGLVLVGTFKFKV